MILASEPATFLNTSKNDGTENIVDFSEITTKLLEKNKGNIESPLEECRKVGASIAWSILWELELLKKENASDILEEEDKSENSKNQKKIEENAVRLFFGEL